MENMEALCCMVLVLMLQLSWSFSSSPLCLPDQRDALLQFKDTISINRRRYCDYPRTESWNKSIDCCSWEGVDCDKLTGLVLGIDVSQSCLAGYLHANNSLFHLHNLQWLDLSSNDFHGSLLENTSSLFHLHRLQRLNLGYNYFDGIISSELFTQLVSLTHLNLSGSRFSGLIPYHISLSSNLVSLDLYSDANQSLRLDAQGFEMLARNLTKLRHLVLDFVDMSDVALTTFLNLTSSLESLSLTYCQLHGEFPDQIFQIPNLKHIDLSLNNNLTGYLPMINWSDALEVLHLSRCDFKGSIPASFGNLTRIESIDLSGNQLPGPIPDVFGNLNRLTSLSFSSCNLSGPFPVTLLNLTGITLLDLSHNHLEGSLPTWCFANLSSLLDLDLSYNKLSGPMDRIQMPSFIQHVDLSSNDLYGPLHDSIFDLVSLTSLHLSSNNLSGVIKSDMLSKLTNLEVLEVSNNSLLSLSTSDNDVSCSFPSLEVVLFSSCSVRQFPNFFRTSDLEVLDLSNNMISGGISKWEAQGWGELAVLNLSYNSLTTLEQFPGKRLRLLDLRSNMLEGSILSTCLDLQIPNPQLLEVLVISDNKLKGNIPPSICNWSSLAVLDLSKNNLSGTIPECLGNFIGSLEFMDLRMNSLSGNIPDSFVNNRLIYLLLSDNQLEGLVPPSLANSASLEVLNLGHNKLTDRFPDWLASLPRLQVLILRSNRFFGSLPDSLASSNYSSLQIVDVSENEFSGPLPRTLFQNLRAMKIVPKERPSYSFFYAFGTGGVHVMYKNVYYYQISVTVTTKRLEIELTKTADIFVSMDLSNNQFCGEIPQEVGHLISLQMLNFSYNNITGPIPTSFGNLVALESLDLSSNKLSGGIPSQMTKLTFLEVLNLSENNLVGPIPHGNQFGTFDNDSYRGNMGLCGLPLSKTCFNYGEAGPPGPSVAKLEDSQVPYFWILVIMGYGSGVVVGLSLGYMVFTTGRPSWFVRMVERDLQYKFANWIGRNRPKRN